MDFLNFERKLISSPVPVAARSNAWVCGPLACWDYGYESRRGHGSLLLVNVVRSTSLRRADHSSRGVLPSVVCVTEPDHETSIMRRPWSTRAVEPWSQKRIISRT
jgi:hypothetical protein